MKIIHACRRNDECSPVRIDGSRESVVRRLRGVCHGVASHIGPWLRAFDYVYGVRHGVVYVCEISQNKYLLFRVCVQVCAVCPCELARVRARVCCVFIMCSCAAHVTPENMMERPTDRPTDPTSCGRCSGRQQVPNTPTPFPKKNHNTTQTH